jgi:hypothetical protein
MNPKGDNLFKNRNQFLSILCLGASFREPLLLKGLGILLFSSGCLSQSLAAIFMHPLSLPAKTGTEWSRLRWRA